MPGKISTCLTTLVALLYNDPFFTDRTNPAVPVVLVPVISRLEKDIDNVIDQALAEIGVGVVVTVTRSRKPTSAPGKNARLIFAITALDNTLVNETNKNAYDVVERAWNLVELKPNGVSQGEGENSRFVVDADAIRPVPPLPKKPFINMQLLSVTTEINLTT